MKKVLILAYDFPPYVSVGGLRPYNWYKHFHERGLYPIVFTRQWKNEHGSQIDYISKSESKSIIIEETEFGTIFRTPFSPNLASQIMLQYGEKKFIFIRRFITLFYEIFQFVFPIGSKANLFLHADIYLKKNSVDFILATGEPFVLFHYANKLSSKYHIPWGADYRDPWALNTLEYIHPLVKLWYSFHERRLIKKMNLILTVSEFMKKKINDFNKSNIPIEIIANGFDSENISKIQNIEQTNEILTFAYAGMIYPYHPYLEFLQTLEDYSKLNSTFRFELNMYGVNIENKLKEIIEKQFKNIKSSIHFYPKLPNLELLKKLSKSNVLILFNEYSFMGTKIYDYLGVDRYILHCFTEEESALKLKDKYFPMEDEKGLSVKLQENLIQYTHSGVSIKDRVHLSNELSSLFEKFKNQGNISTNSINREFFSRKSQTEKLARTIINSLS